VKTTFENQLLLNLWKPTLWELSRTLFLQFLKPSLILLKLKIKKIGWFLKAFLITKIGGFQKQNGKHPTLT